MTHQNFRPSLRQKKLIQSRRKHRRFFWFFVIFFLFLGGVLYLIFLSGFFDIRNFHFNSPRFVDAEVLKNEIQGRLNEGELFNLFNVGNNWLFVFRKDFEPLLEKYPPLQNFELFKNFYFREISLRFVERQIEGIWCGENEWNKCFYFDQGGLLFIEAPESSGNLIFLIRDLSGRFLEVGDKIFSEADFPEFLKIKNIIANQKPIEAVFSTEKELTVQLVDGPKIYLNPSDFSRTLVVLGNLFQGGLDLQNLEYLDLRYLPNVYYK